MWLSESEMKSVQGSIGPHLEQKGFTADTNGYTQRQA